MKTYKEMLGADKKVLENELSQLHLELFELKIEKEMKKHAGGLEKPHLLKAKRKEAARMRAALHSRR